MKPHQIQHVQHRVRMIIREKVNNRKPTAEEKRLRKQLNAASRKEEELRRKLGAVELRLSEKEKLEDRGQRIMDELILGDEAQALKLLSDFEKGK